MKHGITLLSMLTGSQILIVNTAAIDYVKSLSIWPLSCLLHHIFVNMFYVNKWDNWLWLLTNWLSNGWQPLYEKYKIYMYIFMCI